MFASGDAIDSANERRPGLALFLEHATAFGGQPIEPPPPLAGPLDPRTANPTTFFEPIEQRIERRDVEGEPAFRLDVDQLAEFIAVPGARLEQREEEQLSRSLLELAIQRAGIYISHRHILHRQTIQSQWLRAQGSGLRAQGSGLRAQAQDLGLRILGLERESFLEP